GNYVALDDPPEEQFGKVMSIPDQALPQWWRLCLGTEPPAGEPMEAKLALARGIVARWHGADAARLAEEHFTRVVREGQAPDEVPEAVLPGGDPVYLPALLVEHLDFGSNSEVRRLIGQGAVRVDGEIVHELELPRERLANAVIQAGKRQFVRFRA